MPQDLPPTMRAARIAGYGGPDKVVIDSVPLPRPGPDEVLVRVHAAPVTAGDVRMRSGKVPRGFGLLMRLALGWSAPRNPPGWSFSGEVAAPGSDLAGFAPGNRVFGLCGLRGGAHAGFVAVKAAALLPLPDSLDHAEGAAFFFGGLTALDLLLTRAALQPGERVLINGATGAVGSAALQLAAGLGAQVTAVASAPNHDLARRLGAAAVIDYRHQPVSGEFDVVMDVIGTLPWSRARRHLGPGGRLVAVTADLPATLGAALWPRRDGRRLIAGTSSEARAMQERLLALHLAGQYRPVVGQTLPFADLPRAHAIAETFHKPGNLVVTM